MILKFTNEQIFFCLESIWNKLDYRFKTHINQIVTANKTANYIQNININPAILLECYKAISSNAYGCTTDMAEILLESLKTQLLEKANITEYSIYAAQIQAQNAEKEQDKLIIIGLNNDITLLDNNISFKESYLNQLNNETIKDVTEINSVTASISAIQTEINNKQNQITTINNKVFDVITTVIPNEETISLINIGSEKEKDVNTKEAKIANGKSQILQ